MYLIMLPEYFRISCGLEAQIFISVPVKFFLKKNGISVVLRMGKLIAQTVPKELNISEQQ